METARQFPIPQYWSNQVCVVAGLYLFSGDVCIALFRQGARVQIDRNLWNLCLLVFAPDRVNRCHPRDYLLFVTGMPSTMLLLQSGQHASAPYKLSRHRFCEQACLATAELDWFVNSSSQHPRTACRQFKSAFPLTNSLQPIGSNHVCSAKYFPNSVTSCGTHMSPANASSPRPIHLTDQGMGHPTKLGRSP